MQFNLTRECRETAVEILQSARKEAEFAAENPGEMDAKMMALQGVEQLVLAADVLVSQMTLTKRRIGNEDRWIREARVLGVLPDGLVRGLFGYYAGGLALWGVQWGIQNGPTAITNLINGLRTLQ